MAQLAKNLPAMWETWDRSLGRSPGEGKGYPLQYSGLENSMDSIVLGVAKSWTRLSNFHYHKHSTSFFEKQNPEKQGRQTLKTDLQSFRSLTLEWHLVECESQSIDIYRMPVWLHFSGVVAKKDHSLMLFAFFTQSMALLSSSGLSLTWQQVSIMAL